MSGPYWQNRRDDAGKPFDLRVALTALMDSLPEHDLGPDYVPTETPMIELTNEARAILAFLPPQHVDPRRRPGHGARLDEMAADLFGDDSQPSVKRVRAGIRQLRDAGMIECNHGHSGHLTYVIARAKWPQAQELALCELPA